MDKDDSKEEEGKEEDSKKSPVLENTGSESGILRNRLMAKIMRHKALRGEIAEGRAKLSTMKAAHEKWNTVSARRQRKVAARVRTSANLQV